MLTAEIRILTMRPKLGKNCKDTLSPEKEFFE